jgi:type II secretory pathway component PulF
VTLRHRIRFYQQLAVLMRAGLPIRASLDRLRERLAEKELVILAKKVTEGERLGEAFTQAGFSPFECNLVVAGERSAQLDSIFDHLAEYWNQQLAMRQAVIRPLYYPIAVLHFALIILAVVEGTTLPISTVVTHLVLRLALLYVGFAVIFVLARLSWKKDLVRRIWLRVPVIGNSLRTAYAYRWITALRLEFSSGISLAIAVGDAWRASGYVGAERLAVEGEQSMRQGIALSTLVQQWKKLPRDWVDFIETGEISGKLEEAFTNLQTEAATAWKLAQERMADWLPKIIYFGILLIVGAIVFKLMYQMEIAPVIDAENAIDNASK